MAVNRGCVGRDGGVPSAPLPDAIEPFLGRSDALTGFLAHLSQVAASEATVLFTGESGSGKTRAARLLHEWSSRSSGPFVTASLAALSSTLIESALFGHERGAYTDAHRERSGLFRRAHGGTLVLDDVDHLPSEIQVKLLRVLQERVIEPLGAEGSVPVDVRVTATGSGRLESAIEEGRFRRDLYYRLAVVTLEVPPLRSRLEDLSALCERLIQTASARTGAPARPLSPQALERLRAHSWPGNVRELENALERVLILAPERDHALPIEAGELDFLELARAGAAEELARTALSMGLTVERVGRAMMERALAEHRGNVSAAARAVGMTRRAFDYRMGREGGSSEDDGGGA